MNDERTSEQAGVKAQTRADTKRAVRYSDVGTLAWPEERDACGVGFVADIRGRKSHRTLQRALTALQNLSHRGAVSADGLTGDGAGVLTGIPHGLFRRELAARGVTLERDEDLGVGVFFVSNEAPVERMYALIDEAIARSALEVLCWRDVPINDDALGEEARRRRPILRHVLLKRPAGLDDDAFERLLYLTRKRIENALWDADLGRFYIPSFSHRTLSYKGLMVAPQLSTFYLDLADPVYETSIAVFHQRYSTNTMPRWSLAQPFRFLAHNGEINTLQGNVNFMRGREPVLSSPVWGDALHEILPVIEPDGSDSAALDNAFELLVLSGRDPAHALMMLVPEAFEETGDLDPDLRGFYDYPRYADGALGRSCGVGPHRRARGGGRFRPQRVEASALLDWQGRHGSGGLGGGHRAVRRRGHRAWGGLVPA